MRMRLQRQEKQRRWRQGPSHIRSLSLSPAAKCFWKTRGTKVANSSAGFGETPPGYVDFLRLMLAQATDSIIDVEPALDTTRTPEDFQVRLEC
jgi:hypothetical protein